MKGGLGMGQMMRQAQKVQEALKQAQEDMAKLEIEGESGGGMVKICMNGRHDVQRVEIDPVLMNDDREMLEDLIAAAVNDAVRKVESVSQEKMAGVTGGLNLPPGLNIGL